MTTLFKNNWFKMRKDNAYAHPLVDLETLDFGINDLTLRMMEAPSFEEWKNLFHERERVQIQRDSLAQTI